MTGQKPDLLIHCATSVGSQCQLLQGEETHDKFWNVYVHSNVLRDKLSS